MSFDEAESKNSLQLLVTKGSVQAEKEAAISAQRWFANSFIPLWLCSFAVFAASIRNRPRHSRSGRCS